jgi:hypothetical protein
MSGERVETVILRKMAWERAKGELHSILTTYIGNYNYSEMKVAIDQFIENVEENGLTDS